MSAVQTTGLGLLADDAYVGLLDHGLFNEKLPSCFSSRGLAHLATSHLLEVVFGKDGFKPGKLGAQQPRGYVRHQSIRDVNVPRQLGIPHPQGYFVQCYTIRHYWDEITEHCAKPDRAVSRIFVRRAGPDRIFEMGYKGPEIDELEEQDLGFATGSRFYVRADISSCFPSIYTHSISWALHGKTMAKTSRGSLDLPGNVLDRVTRILRDGQSNGLLIGPHSSNILSEIVLTSVDDALLRKGFERLTRYIDDYHYYAGSHEEAEFFVRELGLALREFELVLNERKTQILPSPRPQVEYWIRELKAFDFSVGEIPFGTIRNFLDLALHLAQGAGTSAVLNYAIKMLPMRLDERAARLFTLAACNLALSYPYLVPLLDEHVFNRLPSVSKDVRITHFLGELVTIGIQRIYPDAIAHALYLAIKYELKLPQSEKDLGRIIPLNDCVCDVLLLEYSRRMKLGGLVSEIIDQANTLRKMERREQDAFWLLIYQAWTEDELRDNGQDLLAELKKKHFEFVRF